MPVSGSTGEPPPHLSPAITAASPRVAWTTRVTATPGHMSAPVEGQLVCVERSTAAVGLPSAVSARCFSGLLYPLMIWIGNGSRAAIWTNLSDSSSEISQRPLSAHAEEGSGMILSGTIHLPGGRASFAPTQILALPVTVLVPLLSASVVKRIAGLVAARGSPSIPGSGTGRSGPPVGGSFA